MAKNNKPMGRPVGFSPGYMRTITHKSGDWSWNSDLLWSKVIKTNKCWTWSGAHGPYGALFGAYKNNKQQMTQVRRLIWGEIHQCDITNIAVHHTCGNRMCVNPDHMYEKTNLRIGSKFR